MWKERQITPLYVTLPAVFSYLLTHSEIYKWMLCWGISHCRLFLLFWFHFMCVMCLNVCMHVGVFVYALVCLWRPGVDWEIFLNCSLFPLEAVYQSNPEPVYIPISVATLLQGSPGSTCQGWNYKQATMPTWHLCEFYGLNSGLHTNTLFTKPSPCLHLRLFFFFFNCYFWILWNCLS